MTSLNRTLDSQGDPLPTIGDYICPADEYFEVLMCHLDGSESHNNAKQHRREERQALHELKEHSSKLLIHDSSVTSMLDQMETDDVSAFAAKATAKAEQAVLELELEPPPPPTSKDPPAFKEPSKSLLQYDSSSLAESTATELLEKDVRELETPIPTQMATQTPSPSSHDKKSINITPPSPPPIYTRKNSIADGQLLADTAKWSPVKAASSPLKQRLEQKFRSKLELSTDSSTRSSNDANTSNNNNNSSPRATSSISQVINDSINSATSSQRKKLSPLRTKLENKFKSSPLKASHRSLNMSANHHTTHASTPSPTKRSAASASTPTTATTSFSHLLCGPDTPMAHPWNINDEKNGSVDKKTTQETLDTLLLATVVDDSIVSFTSQQDGDVLESSIVATPNQSYIYPHHHEESQSYIEEGIEQELITMRDDNDRQDLELSCIAIDEQDLHTMQESDGAEWIISPPDSTLSFDRSLNNSFIQEAFADIIAKEMNEEQKKNNDDGIEVPNENDGDDDMAKENKVNSVEEQEATCTTESHRETTVSVSIPGEGADNQVEDAEPNFDGQKEDITPPETTSTSNDASIQQHEPKQDNEQQDGNDVDDDDDEDTPENPQDVSTSLLLQQEQEQYRQQSMQVVTILRNMKRHSSRKVLQQHGIKVLLKATNEHVYLVHVVAKAKGMAVIFDTMKRYPLDRMLQYRALFTLSNMATVETYARDLVVEHDGMNIVVDTMTEFDKDAGMVIAACDLIGRLIQYDDLKQYALDAKAVKVVAGVFGDFKDNDEVLDASRAVMKSLL